MQGLNFTNTHTRSKPHAHLPGGMAVEEEEKPDLREKGKRESKEGGLYFGKKEKKPYRKREAEDYRWLASDEK